MPTANPFLERLLDPGEQILWQGQPKQGVRLQASDAFLIPFSLMWGGFALFWEAGVLGLIHLGNRHQDKPPLFMALWGIPFVVIGLYIMVGRFFFDAFQRTRTVYLLTDRRAIIWKNVFSQTVASFDLRSLNNLNLTERGDGSGDIIFGQPGPFYAAPGAGWPTGRNSLVPGFYLLPDARDIFNRVRAAQQAAR